MAIMCGHCLSVVAESTVKEGCCPNCKRKMIVSIKQDSPNLFRRWWISERSPIDYLRMSVEELAKQAFEAGFKAATEQAKQQEKQ